MLIPKPFHSLFLRRKERVWFCSQCVKLPFRRAGVLLNLQHCSSCPTFIAVGLEWTAFWLAFDDTTCLSSCPCGPSISMTLFLWTASFSLMSDSHLSGQGAGTPSYFGFWWSVASTQDGNFLCYEKVINSPQHQKAVPIRQPLWHRSYIFLHV